MAQSGIPGVATCGFLQLQKFQSIECGAFSGEELLGDVGNCFRRNLVQVRWASEAAVPEKSEGVAACKPQSHKRKTAKTEKLC